MVFGVSSVFFGLILFFLGIFLRVLGSLWVLVGFLLVVMLRKCKCGFWRTSGRFRGTFEVDLWLLGFSFVVQFDPVLVWGVFDVFCGLRWVLLSSRWL